MSSESGLEISHREHARRDLISFLNTSTLTNFNISWEGICTGFVVRCLRSQEDAIPCSWYGYRVKHEFYTEQEERMWPEYRPEIKEYEYLRALPVKYVGTDFLLDEIKRRLKTT
jgi:hypothetical protein